MRSHSTFVLVLLSLVSNEAVRSVALRLKPTQAVLLGIGMSWVAHAMYWGTAWAAANEPYKDYRDYGQAVATSIPAGIMMSLGSTPVYFGLVALALTVTSIHQCAAGMIALTRLIWIAPLYCAALAISKSSNPSFGLMHTTKPAWTLSPIWDHLSGWPALYGLVGVSLLHSVWVARGTPRCRKGLCRMCGYDVRGIRGTCPECGEAVAQEKAGG